MSIAAINIAHSVYWFLRVTVDRENTFLCKLLYRVDNIDTQNDSLH